MRDKVKKVRKTKDECDLMAESQQTKVRERGERKLYGRDLRAVSDVNVERD